MTETSQTETFTQTESPQVVQQADSRKRPGGMNMDVGLLVWSALLIIVGIILVIVPAISAPSSVPLFQVSVVTLFFAAGLAFLGLAYYLARKGGPHREQ